MPVPVDRRRFLSRSVWASGGLLLPQLWTPGVFAEQLIKTPTMAEGPFYPDKLPLDTDNDLLILNDSITPALGEVSHVSGRVLTTNGSPVRNAFVEIWQGRSQWCLPSLWKCEWRDTRRKFPRVRSFSY